MNPSSAIGFGHPFVFLSLSRNCVKILRCPIKLWQRTGNNVFTVPKWSIALRVSFRSEKRRRQGVARQTLPHLRGTPRSPRYKLCLLARLSTLDVSSVEPDNQASGNAVGEYRGAYEQAGNRPCPFDPRLAYTEAVVAERRDAYGSESPQEQGVAPSAHPPQQRL